MKEIIDSDVVEIERILCGTFRNCKINKIDRLGGLTNHTYKVSLEDNCAYVVRIPGEGTEELINRSDEKISTQLACDLGIDTKMIYFGDKGEKITCYIEDAQTMDTLSFQNTDMIRKAAEVLRVLHTCGKDTKIPFDVFDMAAGYEEIIQNNSVKAFEDYTEVKAQIETIRSYIEEKIKITYVPCHNDPLCENWVLGKCGKLFLIDWEYAGMNDAMWDLADLSIEADFSVNQDEKLLQFYFGREAKQNEIIRFHANKLYLDFLWSLWGKARAPFDGEAMERYGEERYARLKRNLVRFSNEFLPETRQ